MQKARTPRVRRRAAAGSDRPGRAAVIPAPPFRRTLLAWYRRNGRDLPWRRTRDPYPVWISEIMLQQTTVKAATPYYGDFLARFPTVRALAEAPLEDVLAAWSGLGYYSRARNLHAAARRVVADHDGRFPDDPQAARALPGVGRYTAAAVLSIVYDRPLAVLDGNVVRVLARLTAAGEHAKDGGLQRRLWNLAQELLDPKRPGDSNQAMMELGATLCTPAAPDCPRCPVARWCRARAVGRPEAFPAAPPKPRSVEETWQVALVERRGRILVRQRPDDAGMMPGMWELPAWPGEDPDTGREPRTAAPALRKQLRRDLDPAAKVVESIGVARHSIMNRKLILQVHRVELPAGWRPPARWRWVTRADLAGLGQSSMVRKVLALDRDAHQFRVRRP